MVLVGYQRVVQEPTLTRPQQDRRAHWERTVLHMPLMVVVLEQEEVVPMAVLEVLETQVTSVHSEARQDRTLCRPQDHLMWGQELHREAQQVVITKQA